jgi:hypothetical protein
MRTDDTEPGNDDPDEEELDEDHDGPLSSQLERDLAGETPNNALAYTP